MSYLVLRALNEPIPTRELGESMEEFDARAEKIHLLYNQRTRLIKFMGAYVSISERQFQKFKAAGINLDADDPNPIETDHTP